MIMLLDTQLWGVFPHIRLTLRGTRAQIIFSVSRIENFQSIGKKSVTVNILFAITQSPSVFQVLSNLEGNLSVLLPKEMARISVRAELKTHRNKAVHVNAHFRGLSLEDEILWTYE